MCFFSHLLKLFSCKSIQAEIKFIDRIEYNSQLSKALMAEESNKIIKESFIPIA